MSSYINQSNSTSVDTSTEDLFGLIWELKPLPMVTLPQKETTEIDFRTPFFAYLRDEFGENPNTYLEEIANLSRVREAARMSSRDQQGRDALYKYFGQLELLDIRFQGKGSLKVQFPWVDSLNDTVTKQQSLAFEKACILYNVAATCSAIAARSSLMIKHGHSDFDDTVKLAYNHFQCAAWICKYINTNFLHAPSKDLSRYFMETMCNLMLAQAQECFLEKVIENKKSGTFISKICFYIVSMMAKVYLAIHPNEYSNEINVLAWKDFCECKMYYYSALAYASHGLELKKRSSFGEALAHLKMASTQVDLALSHSKDFSKVFPEFSVYVLNPETMRKMHEFDQSNETAAVSLLESTKVLHNHINFEFESLSKDNDTIYMESIPEQSEVRELEALCAVKPIAFEELFSEGKKDVAAIVGQDIFKNFIPMHVHEAATVYSEEKAKKYRSLKEKSDFANDQLDAVIASLKFHETITKIQSLLQITNNHERFKNILWNIIRARPLNDANNPEYLVLSIAEYERVKNIRNLALETKKMEDNVTRANLVNDPNNPVLKSPSDQIGSVQSLKQSIDQLRTIISTDLNECELLFANADELINKLNTDNSLDTMVSTLSEIRSDLNSHKVSLEKAISTDELWIETYQKISKKIELLISSDSVQSLVSFIESKLVESLENNATSRTIRRHMKKASKRQAASNPLTGSISTVSLNSGGSKNGSDDESVIVGVSNPASINGSTNVSVTTSPVALNPSNTNSQTLGLTTPTKDDVMSDVRKAMDEISKSVDSMKQEENKLYGLKSEREHLLQELHEKIHVEDITTPLLLNSKNEGHVIQVELSKFVGLETQLNKNLHTSTQLQDKFSTKFKELLERCDRKLYFGLDVSSSNFKKMDHIISSEKNNIIGSWENSVRNWNEIRRSLNEGIGFYLWLQTAVSGCVSSLKNLTSALEEKNRIKDIHQKNNKVKDIEEDNNINSLASPKISKSNSVEDNIDSRVKTADEKEIVNSMEALSMHSAHEGRIEGAENNTNSFSVNSGKPSPVDISQPANTETKDSETAVYNFDSLKHPAFNITSPSVLNPLDKPLSNVDTKSNLGIPSSTFINATNAISNNGRVSNPAGFQTHNDASLTIQQTIPQSNINQIQSQLVNQEQENFQPYNYSGPSTNRPASHDASSLPLMQLHNIGQNSLTQPPLIPAQQFLPNGSNQVYPDNLQGNIQHVNPPVLTHRNSYHDPSVNAAATLSNIQDTSLNEGLPIQRQNSQSNIPPIIYNQSSSHLTSTAPNAGVHISNASSFVQYPNNYANNSNYDNYTSSVSLPHQQSSISYGYVGQNVYNNNTQIPAQIQPQSYVQNQNQFSPQSHIQSIQQNVNTHQQQHQQQSQHHHQLSLQIQPSFVNQNGTNAGHYSQPLPERTMTSSLSLPLPTTQPTVSSSSVGFNNIPQVQYQTSYQQAYQQPYPQSGLSQNFQQISSQTPNQYPQQQYGQQQYPQQSYQNPPLIYNQVIGGNGLVYGTMAHSNPQVQPNINHLQINPQFSLQGSISGQAGPRPMAPPPVPERVFRN